jgi:hypothetical protein
MYMVRVLELLEACHCRWVRRCRYLKLIHTAEIARILPIIIETMATIPCVFVQKELLLSCPESEVADADSDCEVREVVLGDEKTIEAESILTHKEGGLKKVVDEDHREKCKCEEPLTRANCKAVRARLHYYCVGWCSNRYGR